jgi:hypothetical protein
MISVIDLGAPTAAASAFARSRLFPLKSGPREALPFGIGRADVFGIGLARKMQAKT